MIYPDHPAPSIPWNWVVPLAVTLLFNAITFGRTVVTEQRLEKFQELVRESYFKPLADKILPLENYRLEAMRDMGKLQSDMNETKATVGFVKDNLLQAQSSARDSTAELKSMIRDLSAKLERDRMSIGRPQSQGWPTREFYTPDLYPTLRAPVPIVPAAEQ